MPRLLRVSGDSLLPKYRDGDFVLVARIPLLFRPLRQGDVVAFKHVGHGTMIKIVHEVIAGGDEITVRGTHFASVDSRSFGSIRKQDVLGRLIWHIRRPSHS